jgi:L-2-hydroxyglutarate oxidase LhgO
MSRNISPVADVTIIGAGVVGLAIASEVAREDREVYLLERNQTFGEEQSSRNSEVVHAGIYYNPDSLRLNLCLEGNRLIYELGKKNGVPCRNCGKIIIAINPIEEEELAKLYQFGKNNGVPLKMLSRRGLSQLEPNVQATAACFSPTTGIVDSHSLMSYFLNKARASGAQVVYRSEVTRIEKTRDGYEVGVSGDSGESSFATRVLINCAGLNSDKVAGMLGIDIDKANYRLHWCKGEYYSVSGGKNKLINRLIYPVPMTISVGVHVCFDVNWRLRIGPLFRYVNERNYKIDDSRKGLFLESSMIKALPFIKADDLEPDSTGIMAMLQGEDEPFRDFVIKHEIERGLPGFINLVGIESPGLTSSPAIGKYVGRMVDEILK